MRTPRPRLSGDYWLLWSATALSNLGDGIRLGALPLLTVSITRDPLAVTLVSAITFLPWVVVGVIGGALVDRHDRRWLTVCGQVGRGLAVAALAVGVATDHVGLSAIYLVAFVIGVGEVIVDTASQAAVPLLAPPGPGGLEVANGRIAAAQLVANEVFGTPLGAFLFAASATVPFGLDAATFLVGALLVSTISTPLQGVRTEPRARVVDDIREGFRFLLAHPFLRPVMVAVGLLNVAFTAMGSLFVLLVLEVFEAPSWTFGALIAVGAVGGFLGSLVAGRVSTAIGRGRALLASSVAGLLAECSIGLAPGVVVAMVLFFVSAFMAIVGNVVGQSIRQEVTPDHLLGRVVASYRMVGISGIPVGAVLGGVVAGLTGIRSVFAVAAVVGAIACLLLANAVRHLPAPAATAEQG